MLLIVGTREPLYEAEFNPTEKSDETAHLNQFILHSAMDMVDETAESTSNMYLKIVDRFNEQNVFAFITSGNIRLLLLHEGRNEEAVRNFFVEVYELYVKLLMNPFYQYDTPILSPAFDQRVHTLARRYL
ncbi:trafficking protein particle complex subunit 2 putat [Pelagophyceae sp. CCMP2097]|nr:trafficking protein particle complex subunit 2 putat [Pelagophyceae sp. CCMP2097]|mmetsp:Transcript_8819/g.29086  ORF Transcript_8819/g.29086 Transcript_8819/m.29086 type:complete len:130 (+) Transcript_8819:94-483(+)|eukprot:CAMPEP_0184120528 /NCGR_PEP_ID=MMETSP0974-20121125/22508_1 /TAXON_ID=483370 /ORGANISM="non described non described, Strain CCMP2097" /LENGTH=129 /DNA_ID=CAMNT_0026423717 /DNA_START=76 /DNA_END=465 /DNA_ORIENTATION=+